MFGLKSFNYYLKSYDGQRRIPRPRTEPQLPPHLALLRLTETAGKVGVKFVFSLLACYLIYRATVNFRLSFPYSAVGYILSAACVMVGVGDGANDALPYYAVFDRSTYGTQQWATFTDLSDMDLARRARKRWKMQKGDPWRYGDLRLGRLHDGNELVLPLDYVMSHVAFFGPPRSGKSNTFVYNLLVQWARSGSTLVLDPKGELYHKTAHHYRRVYRFDLSEPEKSDRWDFVRACRNPEFAYLMASIILGAGAAKQGSNNEQFWEKSEVAGLTATLLHLAEVFEYPSASMICEFLGNPELSIDDLTKIFRTSPNRMARLNWGVFLKAKKELQGSIITGICVSCSQFLQDKVAKVMTPLTEEERGLDDGPAEIDFAMLREPGTVIYVVIPEGEAGMYKSVLATFLGLCTAVLRKTDTGAEKPASPVIMLLEEAGNIPIHGLAELLGVGRGRRIGVFLFYQSIPQIYDQYGEEKGGAVLGSIGTKVCLPAGDPATSEYFSKAIGDTTVQQATVVDARGRKNDSHRSSDVQRRLKDASEVRQLRAYTEAVAIIGSAPPVLFVYPKQCRLKPSQFYQPPVYGVPVPVPIEEAVLRQHVKGQDGGTMLPAFAPGALPAGQNAASVIAAVSGGSAAVAVGAIAGDEAKLPVNKLQMDEHRAAAVDVAADVEMMVREELEGVGADGDGVEEPPGLWPEEIGGEEAEGVAAGAVGVSEGEGSRPAAVAAEDGEVSSEEAGPDGGRGAEAVTAAASGASETAGVSSAGAEVAGASGAGKVGASGASGVAEKPKPKVRVKKGAGRQLHGLSEAPGQGELLEFIPGTGDLMPPEVAGAEVGSQPISNFVSSRDGVTDKMF